MMLYFPTTLLQNERLISRGYSYNNLVDLALDKAQIYRLNTKDT